MIPKTQKLGIRKTSQSNTLLGNIRHQSLTAMHAHHEQSLSHMHTTDKELLEVVFSHQTTMKQYTDRHMPIKESPLLQCKA
jgi:hypothetical protein